METKPFLFTLLLILFTVRYSFCGFEYPASTASNAALANSNIATTTFKDALFLNPALSVNSNYFSSNLSYSNLYNMNDLPIASGIAILPYKSIHFGIGINYLGNPTYSESKLILNSAKLFFDNKLAFGISANFYYLTVQNYNSTNAMGFDIGFRYQIQKYWQIAGVVENVNRPKLNGYAEELPQKVQMGLEYQIDDIFLFITVQKDSWLPTELLMSTAYHFSKNLAILSGYSATLKKPTVGFQLTIKHIEINYGLQFHEALGATHFLGIGFSKG